MNLPVSLFLPKRNIISWLKNKRVFAVQAFVKQHVNTQAVNVATMKGISACKKTKIPDTPEIPVAALRVDLKSGKESRLRASIA